MNFRVVEAPEQEVDIPKKDLSQIDTSSLENITTELQDIKSQELYEEAMDVGGYDNLPDNKKLDYRIHIMGETAEQANLELKLTAVGGFDNLTNNEQIQLALLRGDTQHAETLQNINNRQEIGVNERNRNGGGRRGSGGNRSGGRD